MSNLSDFVGGGGGLKPFNDLSTVTGTVNLDVSEFGSFRVKQGAGAITLNVTGKSADTAGYVELFFYPDPEQAVTISGADLVENGYATATGIMKELNYNNVSFDVGLQDSRARDFVFNNDGSKLYMAGGTTDSIYQYDLSVNFDISTASYNSVSFSIAAQSTSVDAVAFNLDGSKMFMIADKVYQYSLSTNFDLSTASYDSVSFDISGQDSSPDGFAFNSDGSKMYMLGYKTLYQYTLSTNFDLSTASYDSVTFDASQQGAEPTGLAFNADGSKMYLAENGKKVINQYTLSTPFDISTISYNSVAFSISEGFSLSQVAFSPDGSKLYMLSGQDIIYQYSPTYDLGPLFLYQIIHTGTAATFNTLNSEYSIEVAT